MSTAPLKQRDVHRSTRETHVTPEDDAKNGTLSQAMSLILAARDRVLTLAEQRVSFP